MEDRAFVELRAARLVLRRFRDADAPALAAYRSDPEVARLQGWDAPYSETEARAFIAGLREGAPGRPGAWFQFAASFGSEGDLVGDVGLRTSRSDPRRGELGFTFAREHQGRGLAGEAVARVAEYAFRDLGMHRLVAVTDVENERARRLLERLGFRCEGEFRECTWFKGAWVSERLYARLRSEAPADA